MPRETFGIVLASMDEEGHGPSVLTAISHQTLGEIVGSTRQRINELMSKFRRLDYISPSGARSANDGNISPAAALKEAAGGCRRPTEGDPMPLIKRT